MDSFLALMRTDDSGATALAAPKLGLFRPHKQEGDLVRGGDLLGVLKILERRYQVLAPEGAHGLVASRPAGVEIAVGYGEALLHLRALDAGSVASGALTASRSADKNAEGALVLRAPIHGVFYRRASPGAPAYIEEGATVGLGQTVGLIEVMKTFNPVVFNGLGFPATAVVAQIAAGDRQEVGAGDVLIVFKALAG
jgi:acetyl-CoA carboxylase biotin carboxyl carrier protein